MPGFSDAAADLQADVVIVGGGLSGLAAGAVLRGSDLRVLVLEAGDRLGGRARSWSDAHTGDIVDIGPHILHNYYCNMIALMQMLGTADQVYWDHAELTTLAMPKPPFTMRLRRLPPPFHLMPAGLSIPHVSFADKLSNTRLGWLAMSATQADLRALDDISGEALITRMGVSRRFHDWAWTTAAMTVLNLPIEQCSAGALLRFVRQVIGHNDIRLGFATRGLADLFVPPAVAAIRAEGGEVLLNTRAAAIDVRDGVLRGVVLQDGRRIAARHCIAAVEPQALPALLPAQAGLPDPAAIARLRPSPYISTYLWFAQKLTDKRCWGRMWSPTNLNYDFYDLSNIRAGWAGRPSVVASNIMFADRAAHLSDEQIVAATLGEIADYLPAAAQTPLLHSRVHRIPMGIVCCEPGTDRLRPAVTTRVPGLLVASDWVQTGVPLCMESAVRAAMLAAERIWSDIGQPRRLARELPEPEGLCALLRRIAPGSGMRRALAGATRNAAA